MPQHLMICPHCRAQKWMSPRTEVDISYSAAYFLAICENCDGPVVLLAQAARPKPEYRRVGDVRHAEGTFEGCGWPIRDSWPKPPFQKGSAPQGVPEPIGTLLEHSHEAAERGGYDIAIMGYQRVLKMTQTEVSPDFGGGVRAWILSLIKDGRLTRDIKTWVNRLRLQLPVEEARAVQAEEFATFVHAVLEQLFSTRSKMKRWRGLSAED